MNFKTKWKGLPELETNFALSSCYIFFKDKRFGDVSSLVSVYDYIYIGVIKTRQLWQLWIPLGGRFRLFTNPYNRWGYSVSFLSKDLRVSFSWPILNTWVGRIRSCLEVGVNRIHVSWKISYFWSLKVENTSVSDFEKRTVTEEQTILFESWIKHPLTQPEKERK